MRGKTPRVLVIGAQGALGRLCVEPLRRVGFEVIRAGRRPEKADDFRLVDLDDRASIPEACADADLVISMVNDRARTAERFVLSEGRTMFTIILSPQDRLALKALGEEAKGLVVTDVGLGPGVTSLVFKDLLAAHPDADCMENAGTFSMREPAGRGTAEDFSHPALTGVHRHPTAIVSFPEPFGKLRCLQFTDPDAAVGLIGNLAERLPVRNYGYTLERWVRDPVMALNALGLISKLPLSLLTLTSERQARSTVAKPQCHLCGVSRDGRRLGASAVTGKGNFVMTAAAIATFARVLLDRADSDGIPSGVLGVDDVFELSEVREGFETQGIRIAALP
ncbi:MAG TPA: hypothetical protein VK781_13730 [Solirubrobacteraceae bacterium]|nr:hypothetical protein [Solirubrobacteraceae bacterium]